MAKLRHIAMAVPDLEEAAAFQSTEFGFGLPLGAEYTLGPGGLIAELLFQWGPLKHDITGDTHLGSASLWVGYRALL